MKPRLLDLFCGAGGAARGYADAGFEVVGVDIEPQPNYPFRFIQDDAIAYLAGLGGWYRDVAAIHASPPCQHYADVTSWRGDQGDHPDLIAPTRELLEQVGLPYVIENVRTTELRGDHMLCGTMFGLPIRRHRYFETNWHDANGHWGSVRSCGHSPTDYSFDHGGKQPESVYRDAMGCGWMTVEESREAIPPAYTEHLGALLLTQLNQRMTSRSTGHVRSRAEQGECPDCQGGRVHPMSNLPNEPCLTCGGSGRLGVGPWEVRDNHGEAVSVYTVERGHGDTLEVAAAGIQDYGVACVLEAALNLRDGTVE